MLSTQILRSCAPGLSVRVARDGQEALDFLFSLPVSSDMRIDQPPKLVLLDLNLPFMRGTEVLRRIKSDPRTAKVPVVMLTASSSPADMSQCCELGADAYVVKEIDFQRFSETLSQTVICWSDYKRAEP